MNETGRPQDFPLSNPRADRVRKVAQLAGRPARLKRREFLAEGPQAVREALVLHQKRIAAGEPGIVYEVYASESCLDRHPDLEALAEGTTAYLATDEVLAAMADTVTPQGILAVCGFLDVSLDQVLDAGPRLVAVLCQVRDPGNAGTVLRAADAAGADAVILTASSVDIYNPKAVRSTAGSLFHLPVVLGADVEEAGGPVQGTRHRRPRRGRPGPAEPRPAAGPERGPPPGGAAAVSEYALESPTAWLFGNEAQGLSEEELALADHRVAVPVYGAAESLNLGTAATVCLYASARSQQDGGTPRQGDSAGRPECRSKTSPAKGRAHRKGEAPPQKNTAGVHQRWAPAVVQAVRSWSCCVP